MNAGTANDVPAQSPARPARGMGPAGWIAIFLGAVAVGWVGLDVLDRQMQASPPPALPVRVRLGGVPRWMPPDIARDVLADLQVKVRGRTIMDQALAEDLYHAAAANPWVARVPQVIKYQDGTVLVQAEFRLPFALAASSQLPPGDLRVLDRQAVVLPISPARLDRRRFVLIREVAGLPPAAGKKWNAADLLDGLRLLTLLKDKPYVAQITTIDIRNHAGRIPTEPAIRLRAESPDGGLTDIRFGRFPASDGLDYCLTPQRKIEYLDAYARANGGRLTGANAFLDLRYDELHVSLR